MKQTKLETIVQNNTKIYLTQLDTLKSKYQYLFNGKEVKDLSIKNKRILRTLILKEFKDNSEDLLKTLDDQILEDITIIGITGTVGKTSIAYILNEYLKALGKKSTLLSSASLDIPIDNVSKDNCMSEPITSNNFLKEFLRVSLEFNTEYIIIEVSEEALRDNKLNDIPFDIKILTSFWETWLGEANKEKYFNNKIKFFSNEDDVMYFLSCSAERLPEFIAHTNNYKLFGPKVNRQNVSEEDIDYMIQRYLYNFEEQRIEIKHKDKLLCCLSKYMYGYFSAKNLSCIIGVLDYLNIYNEDILSDVLNKVVIPGREIITVNDRTIIISLNFTNELNDIYEIKDGSHDDIYDYWKELTGENKKPTINRIVVLDGITGYSTKWRDRNNKVLTKENFYSSIDVDQYTFTKSKAFDKIDKVYITNVNQGDAEDSELINFVDNVYSLSSIQRVLVPDRKEAIHKIIDESLPGDVIFISGRASYNVFVKGNKIDIYTDKDIITNVLEELGW